MDSVEKKPYFDQGDADVKAFIGTIRRKWALNCDAFPGKCGVIRRFLCELKDVCKPAEEEE